MALLAIAALPISIPSDLGRGDVFMDRRDALLHLAYSSWTVAHPSPPSVEYAVVDTTRL